jgi:hypothetical protein
MEFEFEHYSLKIKRLRLKQKTVIFSGMIEIPLQVGGRESGMRRFVQYITYE